jgi:hypothetical protein
MPLESRAAMQRARRQRRAIGARPRPSIPATGAAHAVVICLLSRVERGLGREVREQVGLHVGSERERLGDQRLRVLVVVAARIAGPVDRGHQFRRQRNDGYDGLPYIRRMRVCARVRVYGEYGRTRHTRHFCLSRTP